MTVRPIVTLVTIVSAGCAVLAAAACSEHLNGGAACPMLCPDPNPPRFDTTFRIDHLSPVYDTTVGSFPLLGDEGSLLVSNIPNRIDVRGVMRFDSVSNFYIQTVDTTSTDLYPTVAHDPIVWFTVNKNSIATTRGSDQIQFLVYDVDTTADTTVTVLQSVFTPPRLLGTSQKFLASSFADTITGNALDTVIVTLDSVKFLAKVQGDRQLRLGIVAQVANSLTDGARLTIVTTTPAPFIRYWGTDNADSLKKDSSFFRITSNFKSNTPVTDPTLAQRLLHYPLIVKGAIPDSVDALNIGGIPARRVYLKFSLPSRIIDTANVIRATLMLHPKPLPEQIPGDIVAVYPWPVVSSNKVKSAAEATNFIVSNSVYSLDSVQVVPFADSVVSFDFGNAVKNWQNISDTVNTRAIVLRILAEGSSPLEASFWSSFAPDTALRPHVRVQYVKRSSFGVPQ